MKSCSRCKQIKELSEFTFDKSKADGLHVQCRTCKRQLDKERYGLKYKTKRVVQDRERAAIVTERIRNYKKERGCLVCKEVEPICLDLHHLDPSQKDFSVSNRPNSNWDVILAEMNKCVVVCSNCHRKIHAGLITL